MHPLSYERKLKCRNEDASKKKIVATEILLFDFELFLDVQCSNLVMMSGLCRL
jgi:hypothetical protein